MKRSLTVWVGIWALGGLPLLAELEVQVKVVDTGSYAALPGATVCLEGGTGHAECQRSDREGVVRWRVSEAGRVDLSAQLEGFVTTRLGPLRVSQADMAEGPSWRPEDCDAEACLTIALNPDWHETRTVTFR